MTIPERLARTAYLAPNPCPKPYARHYIWFSLYGIGCCATVFFTGAYLGAMLGAGESS